MVQALVRARPAAAAAGGAEGAGPEGEGEEEREERQRQVNLGRERCQVGPNDTSWPKYSYGNTARKG